MASSTASLAPAAALLERLGLRVAPTDDHQVVPPTGARRQRLLERLGHRRHSSSHGEHGSTRARASPRPPLAVAAHAVRRPPRTEAPTPAVVLPALRL